MAGRDYPAGARLNGAYETVVTNAKGVRVEVEGAFCNDKTIACSTTPGAEGLIDVERYDWAHNPAGFGCGRGNGYVAIDLEIVCLLTDKTALFPTQRGL